MTIKPLSDRVLVIKIEGKENSQGGIIIPDKSDGKSQRRKTSAFDSEMADKHGKRFPLEIKKRDYVLFGDYADESVKINVIECIMSGEDDIYDIA